MASTEAFTFQTSIYRDASEGHRYCAFTVPFQRNTRNAVRYIIASSIPDPASPDYVLLDPNINEIGPDNVPSSIFFEVEGLAERLWVRGDTQDVNITVTRL